MLENEFHTSRLIAGHLRGTLSPSEDAEVRAWLAADPENMHVLASFEQEDQLAEELKYYYSTEREDIWERVQSELKMQPKSSEPLKAKLWVIRWAAAASIILGLITLVILHSITDPNGKNNQNAYAKNDISPGSNKAIITLANGKTISLNSSKAGVVIDDSKITYNDGTLIPTEGTGKHSEYATITTPRGGQYQITLSDGTIVFMNAESSLRYPTTFNETSRAVTLQGEAYFEVAKNKRHPFIVTTTQQTIKVLGTHFNISSYAGETAKTTLLEGSVQISGNTVIKPGEQATGQGEDIKVTEADTEEALAWKNGDFIFKEEPLESIMRKVSRWYNVEVVFAEDVPKDIKLGGFVSRSKNISAVLEMIELTKKVKIQVEGRKIIVLNVNH